MSVLATPHNIQSYAAALAEGLEYGDRLHIGVVGNHVSENLVFVGFHNDGQGIVVAQGAGNSWPIAPLLWGDIVELWLLEEKPNPYHSDIPDVAEVLVRIKAAVQTCVEQDNVPCVRSLLNEVLAARRAEPLLKEAQEILANIRA